MYPAIALAALAVLASSAYAQPHDRFTKHGVPVGNFSLRNLDGIPASPVELRGSIWIVQFFYPGCNECSKANPAMKRLQEIYRGKKDIRLVSIALHYGEPHILKEFAAYQNADLDQWLFLADADGQRVHEIVRLSFYNMVNVRANGAAGEMLDHSVRLLLIDSEGIIVGYVNGADDHAVETLTREIDALRMRQRIPIAAADLPWFNALLNSTCTVLLILGWISIRLRYETLHKIVMLLALATSMVFLSSYLFYHFVVLHMEPMRFRGEGWARWVYFTILLSHTILAIAVAPLALTITVQGLRDARKIHVKLARWTLPMWLYVSVTGVVVYWMLYRIEW